MFRSKSPQQIRPRRLMRIILLLISALSIPALIITDQVQSAIPVDASPTGWATVAFPLKYYGYARYIRLRLIYEPRYQLNSTSESVTWLDKTQFEKASKKRVDSYARRGAAYVLLPCKAPHVGRIPTVKVSLLLGGTARLEEPVGIDWKDGEPLIKAVEARNISFPDLQDFGIRDAQAFDFTLSDPPPCTEARTLKQGASLMQRAGDDVKPGFVVTGVGENDFPGFKAGSFMGIPGPRRALQTPLVGGTPTGPAPSPELSGFIVSQRMDIAIMSNMSSEIVAQGLPEEVEFSASDPASEKSNYMQLPSISRVSAKIMVMDKSSEKLWRKLNLAATIYMALGGGVVSALLFELFRSSEKKGKVNQSRRSEGSDPEIGKESGKSSAVTKSPRTKRSKRRRRR
ncbi:hypothetical protein [Microbispora sp. CA-102843]|uniref:hypothetical protein n=1 Tax=Microbispora sp. CA-102843 TaxID=3239952 RepID=UPI003D8EC9EE